MVVREQIRGEEESAGASRRVSNVGDYKCVVALVTEDVGKIRGRVFERYPYDIVCSGSAVEQIAGKGE